MSIKKKRLSAKNRQPFLKVAGVLLLMMAIALAQNPAMNVNASGAADFRMDGTKLVKYAGTAKTVSIPATVTIIGAGAFIDNKELTGVTIPDGVETIEAGAFTRCTALKSVTIPDSVKTLGKSVFSECGSLNSVTVGKGLTNIGSGVFSDCTSLKTATVNAENTVFTCEDGVLYKKGKTIVCQMFPGRNGKHYEMPATVTSIMEYAFWGCDNLKDVNLSNNLKEIPAYAFSSCSGLEKVVIPYSVRNIQMKAFENCSNLTEAEIPDSVTNIHATAFDGCTKLDEKPTTKTDEPSVSGNKTSNNTTETPKTDTTPKTDATPKTGAAQTTDTSQESANASKNAQTTQSPIDGMAATEADNVLGKTKIVGNKAVIIMDSKGEIVVSGNEAAQKKAAEENITTGLTADGTKVTKQAFYRNEALTSYLIPEGVTEIGDFAFARSSLKAITIPEGVKKIGYAAFYHCDDLTAVTIPNTVTEIGDNAFAKTKWMQDFMADKKASPYLIVGDGILIAYKGSDSVVKLPKEIKQIGPGVFKGHEEITEVAFPKGLWAIGQDAFAGCINLARKTGGDSLTQIGERAFEGTHILEQ